MPRAHYPQCSAGPLPARPRRSLRCRSPAPLIPLSGWTLWPSSSWIPKTPSKTEKTCFCETFLRRTVCILLHKETQGRAAERFQARVDATCVRYMYAAANYTLRFLFDFLIANYSDMKSVSIRWFIHAFFNLGKNWSEIGSVVFRDISKCTESVFNACLGAVETVLVNILCDQNFQCA